MATRATVTGGWTLTLPEPLYQRLHAHLFPGDDDEHGAVILAGVARAARGTRLLARELHPAQDGIDYVPGQRGYRMLRADFIGARILAARDERLAYLAVHNHGGTTQVEFSGDDLRSHERGYPALLDIAGGMPVGALVFADEAVAGDIWLPGGERVDLSTASVVGRRVHRLTASPKAAGAASWLKYDRQTKLLGEMGNQLLRGLSVGVIGLGGVGSLLVEYLARLGVGRLIVADPDRIDVTNLPRLTGATHWDARFLLTAQGRPEWLRRLGKRFATTKVRLARRLAKRANPEVVFEGLRGDVTMPEVAERFVGCDYLFLAADTMQARLVFNAIVHQYLVPGVQMGSKALPDSVTGELTQVFSVVRPINPASGCLWCSGLISSSKLQEESLNDTERRAQRYIDDPEVTAPSVITLNAVAVAHAANDFLFAVTGLTRDTADLDFLRFQPLDRTVERDEPLNLPGCTECGTGTISRRARGDGADLPTRLVKRPKLRDRLTAWKRAAWAWRAVR